MEDESLQQGVTDDAMVVERLKPGYRCSLVKGSYENMKVTTPEDMEVAAAVLKHRGDRTLSETEG